MGKKGKVGKQRKDKYYFLAKETGFRSRAAFKLIQLNRKFEFLQKSKVVIDLCAAPGGWLQVAQKYMPVSSVIVGVDLVPIKPIYNVITLQEDITTQKCRKAISKELKTWKADVVLNDGAPNVGKSWIHDAFEQNRLTLSALHLACDFLMKGGYFVTKIFRSKDYNALMWVFKKLFKRVHATKPQASRNESAEIFVVCQNYLAPDKIDAKFFDPSFVFAELKEKEQHVTKSDLLKPVTKIKKAKAEGYEDGKILLHTKVKASQFIQSPNYLDLLSSANEIILDADNIRKHPFTTEEIVECLKDLKVLGRKELTSLITWRQKLKADLFKKNFIQNQIENQLEAEEIEEEPLEEDEVDEADLEKSEEARKLKAKKRKISKEKRKLSERINLKMVLKNDQLVQEEQDLFTLKNIRKISQLSSINDDVLEDEPVVDEQPQSRKVLYDKNSSEKYFDPDDSDVSDNEQDNTEELVIENDDTAPLDDEEENELLVDFEDKKDKVNSRTKMFFDNKIFNNDVSDDDEVDNDEDIELQELENRFYKKTKNNTEEESPNGDVSDEEMEFDEQDPEDDKDDFKDELEDSDSKKKDFKEPVEPLSKEEMALGSILIKSKKNRRDLFDDGWNRYLHEEDEFIPSWFRKEEQMHYRKAVPVSNELSKEFNERMKEINSKPIKKVLEAKARKKKRALRRLEKARVKAENVTDDADMSTREKAQYIRSIYKKAIKKDNKKPQLVVAKKQYGNRRPPGVKGRYKIVDKRLKKDKRKEKNQQKRGGKKKSRR